MSALALDWLTRASPLAHRRGPPAELATLRAKMRAASAALDAQREQHAAAELARALAARGVELDLATRLARRSLMMGEDPVLREELSAWFAGLGEAALAAGTLAPLAQTATAERLARVLTRIAVFLGRTGDASGAAAALARAVQADPKDAVAPELRGAIAAWADGALSAHEGAQAYLEGGRRREAAGDKAGAFEDLLRAFEMAPDSAVAAQRLSSSLAARGRVGAADEVMRASARASAERGAPVHLARMRDALAEGDVPRALGAALDARLDRTLSLADSVLAVEALLRQDEPPEPSFDALLCRAGLHEWVAARLELALADASGIERARALVALGQLHAGPLANVNRATEAWIDAVVEEPSYEPARAVLREHAASTGDSEPLVEALIRTAGGAPSDGTVSCLRELAVLAAERLGAPSLALWAVTRAREIEPADPDLAVFDARLRERSEAENARLAELRSATRSDSEGASRSALRQLAAALSMLPDAAPEAIDVVGRLVALGDEPARRVQLERLLSRGRAWAELVRLWTQDIEENRGRLAVEMARVRLAGLKRRSGDPEAAIEVLEPTLADGTGGRTSASTLLALLCEAGRPITRAQALQHLAATAPTPCRAVLAAVAADCLLGLGLRDAARDAAQRACQTDSSLARAVVTLAEATQDRGDRLAAVALERAMGVVVPRVWCCRALAQTLDVLGEPVAALDWTQRWLALRPGDMGAAAALLQRVTAHGDAARLRDALAWLLSQPEPLAQLAPLLSGALRRLAQLDPTHGAAVARRALDVFGPRIEVLRAAVLDVADQVGERGLAIAVIERQLASGAPGAVRAQMLLDLARRRRHIGDADGAARALVRALSEGAAADEVLAELDVALPPRSSDGEISLLQARAEALSGSTAVELESVARAWRELGAGLWDLADDHEGALEAWHRALALAPDRGLETFARDLVAFAGHESALAHLSALAERRNESDAADFLAVAAGVALDAGRATDALTLAIRTLAIDPSHADVLAVAEQSAGPDDVELLERAYDLVAAGALGIYGERAAHYRAARQLERRSARERALRHAVRAFEAVPGEGVSFVLMMRLAERTGDTAVAVEAIERIAERATSPEERSQWLRRAALVSGSGEEGKRQRVDVLLRALDANPELETLRSLGNAMTELVRVAPDEREIGELRFNRALRAMLPRLTGPEGARVAIEAARTALEAFDAVGMAANALGAAVEADASVDEYAVLLDRAELLATNPGAAAGFVQQVSGLLVDAYGNVGDSLRALALRVGDALPDRHALARILVAAARRAPDDDALFRRAEAVAREVASAELLASLAEAMPPEQRVERLLAEARGALEREEYAAAIDSVHRALDVPEISTADAERSKALLRQLYALDDRPDAHEALLRAELDRSDVVGLERRTLMRELAELLIRGARVDHAYELMSRAIAAEPNNLALLTDSLTFARQADDVRWQQEVLGKLAEIVQETPRKLEYLRKLASLLTEDGDEAGALSRYHQILALDPADNAALSALERAAERGGDWEKLQELLERRAAQSRASADALRVRLRRAELFETHLGRPDEARAALEALLNQYGDQLQVLTALADLNERMGAKLRAAPLWLRASAVPKDRRLAGDYACRACQAFLEGGDVDSARRVLSEMSQYPRTQRLVELRVDVERRSENPRGLAEALEEMALSSMDPPEARAALLVEAAQVALSAGELPMALGQAQRAARIARDSAEPQLFAKQLEYRHRGSGNPEEAAVTVRDLRSISGPLSPEQRELHAFLLAEALDVAGAGGAGMRELSQAHAELGAVPLVALGMAERLAAGGEPDRALPLFDCALDGDLHGLRDRGLVAMGAARAAEAAGEGDRALRYLDAAAAMPATRSQALVLQVEYRTRFGRLSEPPLSVGYRPGPATSEGAEERPFHEDPSRPQRETESTEHGAPFAGSPVATDPAEGAERSDGAHGAARVQVPHERPRAPDVGRSLTPAPGSLRAAAPPKPSRRPPPSSAPPLSERSPESAAVDSPRWTATSAPPVMAANPRESALLTALDAGSVEAGKELSKQLEAQPDRTQDWVNVCRRVSALLPGDRLALQKLYEATLADRNIAYARAIEHVLLAFDSGAKPLEPPPLGHQLEEPERVAAMLFRETAGRATEALGIVWNSAQHMFRRDPTSYGVTGLERISPSAPTPLAALFGAAARLLGMSRTPLFQRKSGEPVTINVALLSPPALILSGEVKRETALLSYHLGAMLAATLPQHVLLYGAPEAQVRNVLHALRAAFGPPQSSRGPLATIATLAEMLWESVPARAQRRLQLLCEDPAEIDYDVAVAHARQAVRRSGLFVSGDLMVAVRQTCAELGLSSRGLDSTGGLAALCASSPAVADLVRLATSATYADARWQLVRGSGRSSPAWATFPGRKE